MVNVGYQELEQLEHKILLLPSGHMSIHLIPRDITVIMAGGDYENGGGGNHKITKTRIPIMGGQHDQKIIFYVITKFEFW